MTPATLAEELRDMAADEKAHGDTHTLQVLEESAAILEQVAGADAGCPTKGWCRHIPSIDVLLFTSSREEADIWREKGDPVEDLIKRSDHLAALAQATPSDTERGLYEALKGVVRVADRKTDEFDAARAAIAAYEAKRGGVL